MKQKLAGILLTALVLFLSFNACEDSDVNEPANNQTEEITIGALVSLTGNWSSLGITSKAALEAAVDKINREFENEGSNIRFNLNIVDTELDPEIAYIKTQELIDAGVSIIIGPQSSAELTRIKPLLDANNVFAASMSSTAGSLALPGDHVLRFCPDDKPEGLAVSELMWEKGIRNVVAVFRTDDGNIGLKRSMTSSFSAMGGNVIDSVSYSTDDNITADLINQIASSASASGNSAETGIYLAGFDEVADVLALASSNSVLSSLLWFGSNGSANSAQLVSNETAAAFANQSEFCSLLFALSDENEDEWNSLYSSVQQSTQLEPDAYTFAAYDAVMIAAQTVKSIGINFSFDTFYNEYISTATDYQGLTGPTELNEAGDRKYGNFTMLGICGSDGNYEWTPVGSYNTATNYLNYTGCN